MTAIHISQYTCTMQQWIFLYFDKFYFILHNILIKQCTFVIYIHIPHLFFCFVTNIILLIPIAQNTNRIYNMKQDWIFSALVLWWSKVDMTLNIHCISCLLIELHVYYCVWYVCENIKFLSCLPNVPDELLMETLVEIT